MAMKKLKEIYEEVQLFKRNRLKPSEKLEPGMIASKELYNIHIGVCLIGYILFAVLWVKYSFFTAWIALFLIYAGDRIFFFRSLMKNRRIRETVTTSINNELKLKKQTNCNTSQSKRVKEKEENTQESTPKMFSKKTFDPSKVIIKE